MALQQWNNANEQFSYVTNTGLTGTAVNFECHVTNQNLLNSLTRQKHTNIQHRPQVGRVKLTYFSLNQGLSY